MTKIKEISKRIVNSANFPFLIFFIILILIHIKLGPFHGDDVWFKNIISEEKNLIQYLTERYNIWSSRLIIETVLILVSQFELTLWKFINVAIYMLLAKCISKICLKENNRNLNYIICGLILLIPITALSDAGWIATTTNYLWVVTFGLYSLSIIINYIRKTKIPKWEYIFYLLATIYACNQEQMAAVMFFVFGAFIMHQLLKEGYKHIIKKQKFLIILFIITILSLIFILTCPGNGARKLAELKTWYPEYENFRTLEKAELGLTATMQKIVLDTKNLFIIFTLCILIGVCLYNKNKWIKMISAIPFLASIFYACFFEYIEYFSRNCS